MKKITVLFFLFFPCITLYAQGWQTCGNGVKGYPSLDDWCFVDAMAADTVNNILYVAGDFDTINNSTPVSGIAAWNGTIWQSISTLGSIYFNYYYEGYNMAMIVYHGSLFLPTSETMDYDNNYYTFYYVIKYNGDSIQLLPNLDGPVNCFAVFNDTLYIGGDFYVSDTTTLNHIAKWNGTNWLPVGSGFTSGDVSALGVFGGKLYAGGWFDQSGNTTHLLSIAQWNDTAWAPLGRGIADPVDSSREGFVNAIATYQNNLYVGGDFGFAGGDSANNVAEWNGTEWMTLDKGAENTVSAFATYNNKLYIGGAFAITNLPNSNRLDSWDGFNWAAVDSGLNAPVLSLAVFQNSLYVGGQFDSAGNIIANAIARWSPDSTSSIEQITSPNIQLSIYPNPTSNQLTISTNQLPITEIQIVDVLGQTLFEQTFGSGLQKQVIDVSMLPAGIYFYKITGSNLQAVAGKFVKE